MADQRLVEYQIARLENMNREIRLRAIEELRLLGDEAALQPLEHVFRTDEDEEIRRAAQKAGVEIYLKNHPQVKPPTG
jgi:HEAT repeat protein